MSNSDSCNVEFTVGHEFASLKTNNEKHGILQAWYTDIPPEDHMKRVAEERMILTTQKNVLSKTTSNSFFGKKSSRIIPVGITQSVAVAIEIRSKEEATRIKETQKQYEIDQMMLYFREVLKKVTTQQQLKLVVRELSTTVNCDPSLQEHLLPLTKEMIDMRETLKDDPKNEEPDNRGKTIEASQTTFGTMAMPKIPSKDIKLDENATQYSFTILTCVTPLKKTPHKTSHKRCVWKDKPTVFLCDTGTNPVVKLCSGGHILICRTLKGKLKVDMLTLENWKSVFSSYFESKSQVVDCDYETESERLVVACPQFVLSYYLQLPQLLLLAKISYEDDTEMQVVKCVSAKYNEFIVGTTRGEAIIFDAQSKPTKCHLMTTICDVLKVYRNGANLFAMNIMNTMNLETGDERFFARGVTLATRGRLFCGDRVVASQSCGALVITLNKYGILQVQPNRECPDPNNPERLLPSAIYSKEKYDNEKEAIFINYDAIYAGRTEINCLYPNGMIQCIWIKEDEN